MVMYPYLTPNMETTRGSIPILFTILWTTWEYNPQDISKIGNNMGKHSQDFPSPGIHSKVEPFSQKKPICVIMQGINLPIFSHTRNFLSQVFYSSGKKSHKIPKWESKKVSCVTKRLSIIAYSLEGVEPVWNRGKYLGMPVYYPEWIKVIQPVLCCMAACS